MLRGSLFERAQRSFEGSMTDTCRVLRYSETTDEAGQIVAAYTAQTEGPCRFIAGKSSENAGADLTVNVAGGELWLPSGTVLSRRDRVRITQHQGATVAAEYAVSGQPHEAVGRLVCELREVTG
jgi:hypothetical protein